MEENIRVEEKKDNKVKYIVIGCSLLAGYLIGVKAGKKIAYKDATKTIKNNWLTIVDETTGLRTPLYFHKKDKPYVDLILGKVNEAFDAAEELKKLKAITKEG